MYMPYNQNIEIIANSIDLSFEIIKKIQLIHSVGEIFIIGGCELYIYLFFSIFLFDTILNITQLTHT